MKKIMRGLVLAYVYGLASVFTFFVFSSSASAVCSASMTTSGAVNLEIDMTNGTGMATDEVVIDTDCGMGYSLSIGGGLADNNLYLDGNNASASFVSASSGTKNNPSPVFAYGDNSYVNTWGYSVADNTTITSSTFIGLTNERVQIFDKNIASETGGDTYTVYYGASVASSMPAGTYRMADNAKVVYYLVARPLEFEVEGNPTEWTNQSVTLEVTSDNADSISEYSFDGGATWQNSPEKVFDENISGIEVKVKSDAGWVSPSQVVDITKIDKVAPTMTFDYDIEYNSNHTTKQVTTLIATLGENTSITTGVNVSDGLSGVASGWPKCYRNNTEITSTNVFTAVGRYSITCKAQDNVGNETVENREILIRWPLAGKYVVAKTTIDGDGIAGTGTSSSNSPDGLYEDNVATGANSGLSFASKYYYTGANVDNYALFAGTTFRILNVSTNDDIKLLGAISDQSTAWGNSKIYDSNVYNTWSTKWWPRGQIYNNETGENHYQVFNDTEKAHLDLATFYVGRIDKDNATSIASTINYERTNTTNLGSNNSPSFEGYSAYPNASDFLKASKIHDVVDSISDIDTTSAYSRRQNFANNSWIDMSAEFWTMNGRTGTLLQDSDFWVIDNDMGGHFESRLYSNTQQYRVVLYLKNDTILSGDGSSTSPYTVQEDWAWFDSEQVVQ